MNLEARLISFFSDMLTLHAYEPYIWLHIVSSFYTIDLLYFEMIFLWSLYRGKVGLDATEAHNLMDGLDWQGSLKYIVASMKWLKENGLQKVSTKFELP